MATFKILALPGDGIGPEVTSEAVRVLQALGLKMEMEEALLKQMMKQDNELTEIRTSVVVLNKTFRNGVLVGN